MRMSVINARYMIGYFHCKWGAIRAVRVGLLCYEAPRSQALLPATATLGPSTSYRDISPIELLLTLSSWEQLRFRPNQGSCILEPRLYHSSVDQ